jgi:hypothetical protein
MNIPSEVLSAIIGAISALAVVLIKDVALDTIKEREEKKRELIRQRLENVYVPLNYLIYALATHEHEETDSITNEITQILKKHGHLLTEQTLSGLYILTDKTTSEEFPITAFKQFVQEYQYLREMFYQSQYSTKSLPRFRFSINK